MFGKKLGKPIINVVIEFDFYALYNVMEASLDNFC